jgi:Tol biopolymer transport system component
METFSALAPNGRYLAYMSTESGTTQVYVREVTSEGTAGPGKWQISDGPASSPVWRADGKEIVFIGESGLMAAGVRMDGPTFHASAAKPLGVPRESLPAEVHVHYSVTRDGQRLLIPVPVAEPEPIRILVNWLPSSG